MSVSVSSSGAVLPPNAGPVERALDLAAQRLSGLATDLESLFDPNICPPNWIPFMCWHMGITFWDQSWPLALQRHIYALALQIARTEGTPASVHRILEALDLEGATFDDRLRGFETGVSELGITDLRLRADHLTWSIDVPRRYASHFEAGTSELGVQPLTDFSDVVLGKLRDALEQLKPAHTTLILE